MAYTAWSDDQWNSFVDYERVKLALNRQIPPDDIAQVTGLQLSVVKAYVELVYKYHPDLQSVPALNHFGS